MVHPVIEAEYKKAGFPLPTTPQDTRELAFKRLTRKNADKNEKVINQVWRVSAGRDKDYIVYEEKEIGLDHQDNEVSMVRTIGKYSKPTFRNKNNAYGEPIATEFVGEKTIYEIPYSKQKMREILDSGDSSNTTFVLQVGNQKFGDYGAEDFINKSFEELYQMGVYGTQVPLPPRPEEEEVEVVRAVKQSGKQEEFVREARENARRDKEEFQDETKKRPETMDEQPTAEKKNNNTSGSRGSITESERVHESVNFMVKPEDMEETIVSAEEDPEVVSHKEAFATAEKEEKEEREDQPRSGKRKR